MSWEAESNLSGGFRNLIRVKLPSESGKDKFELYLGKDRERPLAGVVSGRLCRASVFVSQGEILETCIGKATERSIAYGDRERLYVVIGTPEVAGDGGCPLLININFYTFAALKMLNSLAWVLSLGNIETKISIIPDICKENPKFNGYSMSVEGQWVKGKYSAEELTKMGIYKNADKRDRDYKRDKLIDDLFADITSNKALDSVYSYYSKDNTSDAGETFTDAFTSTFEDNTPPSYWRLL